MISKSMRLASLITALQDTFGWDPSVYLTPNHELLISEVVVRGRTRKLRGSLPASLQPLCGVVFWQEFGPSSGPCFQLHLTRIWTRDLWLLLPQMFLHCCLKVLYCLDLPPQSLISLQRGLQHPLHGEGTWRTLCLGFLGGSLARNWGSNPF